MELPTTTINYHPPPGTPCDGELVHGPSSPTQRVCTYQVVVQEDPADDPPPQNRSNTVYITTSLDSDVPIGEWH